MLIQLGSVCLESQKLKNEYQNPMKQKKIEKSEQGGKRFDIGIHKSFGEQKAMEMMETAEMFYEDEQRKEMEDFYVKQILQFFFVLTHKLVCKNQSLSFDSIVLESIIFFMNYQKFLNFRKPVNSFTFECPI